MPQRDLFKRYVDAGMEFSALTQARAEAIVSDLVKAGEIQASQAQQTVQDLVDRSRKNSERLMKQVRNEVRSTVSSLGLATQTDIARIERQLRELDKKVGGPKRTAATKSSATKSPSTKSSATKSSATKKSSPAAKRTTKAASSTGGSRTARTSTPRKRA